MSYDGHKIVYEPDEPEEDDIIDDDCLTLSQNTMVYKKALQQWRNIAIQ